MCAEIALRDAAASVLRRLAAEANLALLCGPVASAPFVDPHMLEGMIADASAFDAIMARLFLAGADQPQAQVRAALGEEAVDLLLGAGVIRTAAGDMLGSARLLVNCCNRHVLAAPPPGHPQFAVSATPYCGSESLWFARYLALRGPYHSCLDLCTGSGLLAMMPDSPSIVAVDIDPSALAVAAFNFALNGRPAATLLQGDLFVPVGDAIFDLVTANPPFLPGGPANRMPASGDGGRRGDEVLARILAEVAYHLAPGGEALIYAEGFGDRSGPAILADLAGMALSGTHDYTCWIGGSRNAQQMIFNLCRLWQLLGATEAEAWAHWREIASVMPVTHYHHAIWRVAHGHGAIAVRRLRQD
jgi:Methyltransferase small domain